MANSASLEYSSLHKFLVSAGIAVVIADAAFAWAVLQASEAILTPQAVVDELTDRGRWTLERQQELLGWILDSLPPIVFISALVGVGLFIAGIARWVPRQRVADKHEEARLEAELRKASLEELESELKSETLEEAAAAAVDVATAGSAGEAAPSTSEVIKLAEDSVRRLSSIGSLHSAVADLFSKAYQNSYTVERDFVVSSDEHAAWVDLLLTPRIGVHASWVVEIKVIASPTRERIAVAVARTNDVASAVAGALGRAVRALVVVIADTPESRNRALASLGTRPLSQPGEVLVLSRDDLSELGDNPAQLGRLLSL